MRRPNLLGPSKPKFRNNKSLTTVSAALITTLTIAEKLVDGIPATGLKAAVGGLLEILKAAKKIQANSQDLNELDAHLRDLSDLLRSIQGRNDTRVTPDLDSRITKLTSDIEGIVGLCESIQSQSFTAKIFSLEDNTSAIIGINKSIERAIRTFQLESALALEQGMADIREHLKRHAVPQDPNDPLNILRPFVANARYDSGSRVMASRCFQGTRSDLLQKIFDWAEDPNAKPIYWLCGLAGTGKSTIAQTVSEAFNHRQMLGASFFCSRDVAERSNPLLVLPTLAYQLGRFHQTFLSRISASIKQYPDACSALLETQMEKLISQPLREATEAPPVVIIVIDALDECMNEYLVQEILILLASTIPKLPFCFRVFITSRPDTHIRNKFREDSMKSVSEASLLHDIDLSIVQHDIELYLGHHLRKIGTDMLEDETWPPEVDLDTLVKRARGFFIYASALIAYIGDDIQREPKERLENLLLDKSDGGDYPYAEIDRLYNLILHGSLLRVGGWSVARRVQPILGTIVLLFDPLSAQSMEKLISARAGSIRPALSPLHSVLSVRDEPYEPIRVFHQSFPDFMTDAQRCTDTRLLIEPNIHHTQLALHCINVMNSNLHRNMCDIQDPFILNAVIQDLHYLLDEKIGSHVIYACRFWAAHLKHADPFNQALCDALVLFITTKPLYWLEVLSLSQHMDSALTALKIAQEWYQEEDSLRLMLVQKMIPVLKAYGTLGDYLRSTEGKLLKRRAPIKTLLYDCQCLVLHFLGPIISSAAHIYQSALPFAPKCLLFEHFEVEVQSSVKVLSKEEVWDPTLAILEGHLDEVNSVSFSADGLRVASGSDDCTVQLWDSTTGTQIKTLEGHAGVIQSVCFSPDGVRIACGCADRTVYLWEVSTGTHIRTLEGHSGDIQSVCFSPDGLRVASGSSDNTICLWDSTSGACIQVLKGHQGIVLSVCFSPDGLQIVSGARDQSIHLWDSITGKHIKTLNGHIGDVNSVCFSPDGLKIASGSDDFTVQIWDSTCRTHIRTLRGHSGWVWSVCFSPDGLRIASGSSDQTVYLWEVSTGTHIRAIKGHSREVYSVCFSPDGLRIASGSRDNTVRLLDSTTSAQSKPLKGHSNSVRAVCSSPDGQRILSYDDKTVCLWDPNTGAHISTLKGAVGDLKSFQSGLDETDIHGIGSAGDGNLITLDTGTLKQITQPTQNQPSHLDNSGANGLWYEDQSVFFMSPEKKLHHICFLPYSNITCHAILGQVLAVGTKSGDVHILNCSSAMAYFIDLYK